MREPGQTLRGDTSQASHPVDAGALERTHHADVGVHRIDHPRRRPRNDHERKTPRKRQDQIYDPSDNARKLHDGTLCNPGLKHGASHGLQGTQGRAALSVECTWVRSRLHPLHRFLAANGQSQGIRRQPPETRWVQHHADQGQEDCTQVYIPRTSRRTQEVTLETLDTMHAAQAIRIQGVRTVDARPSLRPPQSLGPHGRSRRGRRLGTR